MTALPALTDHRSRRRQSVFSRIARLAEDVRANGALKVMIWPCQPTV